ncbi:MAG: hypothetical protein A3J79_05870 [Elusimicrobia bacterium RIFOXYB2_FULL_62_6]|nr:MAG: hypothetical protein A3J79_05870 [Elusimicrobia bacterium RIFOXYB2_FULL_62_6]
MAAQDGVLPSTAAYNEVPEEVVIKGESGERMKTARPKLNIKADSLDSLRRSLGPDRELFLFESGDFLSLSRSNPDKLFSDKVIQPWRAGFSDKTVITFYPLKNYQEVFVDRTDKESKAAQWTLSITDEDGRLFHKYSGAGLPPETINWTGENENREWMRAGRSYAPVYAFTDGSGASRTVTGELIKFTAIVYQKNDNLIISLDSVSLFGPDKSLKAIEKPQGESLLAATVDLIKRKYYGLPVKINVFAQTKDLALVQAGLLRDRLRSGLMAGENLVSIDGAEVPYAIQRADIVLANK